MENNFTDTELANEVWRDIDGYDGIYQVSDLGRVRSRYSGEWKVLRAKKEKNGYLRLDLSKDGKQKGLTVHRIVAMAFIPNDDESKNQVNHKDENKENNRVDNLEWCTAQYNLTYNDLHHRRNNPNNKRQKIEKLYNPELPIKDNIELFKEQGIECSKYTVIRLRKDLKLERPQPKRSKIKDLYDHNLSVKQNIELFRANGIECSKEPVNQLRKDLGLIDHKTKLDKIKPLYNPELTIDENIEIFKANGIKCCRETVKRLRKDLGLTKHYRPRKKAN